MKLFEVFLIEGRDASVLLSPALLEETGAQVMTLEQAEFVGLEGIPADPTGRPRMLIACRPEDERLIHAKLEAHEAVASFRVHAPA
jgi:hypothetical protein